MNISAWGTGNYRGKGGSGSGNGGGNGGGGFKKKKKKKQKQPTLKNKLKRQFTHISHTESIKIIDQYLSAAQCQLALGWHTCGGA